LDGFVQAKQAFEILEGEEIPMKIVGIAPNEPVQIMKSYQVFAFPRLCHCPLPTWCAPPSSCLINVCLVMPIKPKSLLFLALQRYIPKRRKSEGYRGISLLQSQFIEEQFWAQPSILVVLNEEKSLTVGVTFFTWLFERNLNPGFYGSPLMSIPSDRVTRSDPPAPELIQKIRSGERFLQVLQLHEISCLLNFFRRPIPWNPNRHSQISTFV
jgi:hypothetical protein